MAGFASRRAGACPTLPPVTGNSPRSLRVAYFGLPLGAILLGVDGHLLTPCVLSPVHAPGRRRLERAGVRVLDATTLGSALDAAVERALDGSAPDLLVSWFWTRRLPEEWLGAARLGAVGVHPSLLPRHRGPNPYFWAIDAGDSETGVTVHGLEREYDTGPIFAQERLSIGSRNAWQLARALDRPSLRALRAVVQAYATGEPPEPRAQEHAFATQADEPSGPELRADFHWPTERLLRRVRALAPVPGLALTLAGLDFFVLEAHPATEYIAALIPGEAHIHGERLILRTGDGAVRVERAVISSDDDEPVALTGAELASLLAKRLESRAVAAPGDYSKPSIE